MRAGLGSGVLNPLHLPCSPALLRALLEIKSGRIKGRHASAGSVGKQGPSPCAPYSKPNSDLDPKKLRKLRDPAMENATPYNWSPGYWRGRIIDSNLDKRCYVLHSQLDHQMHLVFITSLLFLFFQ